MGAYFLGRNHASVAVQEAQPVQIPQELTNNINALQNKLNIAEQNAKDLAAAIANIRVGKTAPVANYYVTAPTVEKAADIVQQQIKANDACRARKHGQDGSNPNYKRFNRGRITGSTAEG